MRKFANYTKWMLVLSGILMALVAVILFTNPLASAWSTTNVVGWLMLVAAIIDIVAFITNIDRFYAGWLLVRGVVTGLIGAMLTFRPATSLDLLMIIFGLWVIITGSVQFANSFIARSLGQREWFWPLLGGVFEIIAGGIIIIHPGLSLIAGTYVLAASLMVDAITNFVDAFKIQQGLNEINRWEKALKKLMPGA